jgi:hypothetical protein
MRWASGVVKLSVQRNRGTRIVFRGLRGGVFWSNVRDLEKISNEKEMHVLPKKSRDGQESPRI